MPPYDIPEQLVMTVSFSPAELPWFQREHFKDLVKLQQDLSCDISLFDDAHKLRMQDQIGRDTRSEEDNPEMTRSPPLCHACYFCCSMAFFTMQCQTPTNLYGHHSTFLFHNNSPLPSRLRHDKVMASVQHRPPLSSTLHSPLEMECR